MRIAGAANRPGSRDLLPRCVHYWTDVATFSRFYRLRQMGTHYSNWQFEMGILYGLSADTRAGAILFCADHLVLKRLALGIVLRKPRRRGFSVREDLKMIGSSTSLLVSSVDPSCGQTSGPDLLGERRGAGTAHFRGARGLVPEASSKIHGVRNRSYSEA